MKSIKLLKLKFRLSKETNVKLLRLKLRLMYLKTLIVLGDFVFGRPE